MMTVEKYYEALKKFAPTRGLILNPDWEVVKPLLEGLLINGERYGMRTCPCRPAMGVREKDQDLICPCAYADADIEEYGRCYCELFVSQDWLDGKLLNTPIPERRPAEKFFDFD